MLQILLAQLQALLAQLAHSANYFINHYAQAHVILLLGFFMAFGFGMLLLGLRTK